jgi:TrmH family RNA methyltransferase
MRSKSEYLTSSDNRWLKRFRAALQGRFEQRDGEQPMLGLEGPHLVEEALRAELRIEALLVADAGERHLTRLRKLLPSGLRILRTTERLFADAAGTESPQGIAALVVPREWALYDLLGGNPLVVVIAGVQDPGNVGTMVRAAEAFGASGVIACRGTAHPLAPKSLRASAGSALRIPLLAAMPAGRVLADLRARGLRQCAASLSGQCAPEQAGLEGPTALWIGSEGAGLPPEIETAADARVRIPIAAAVESLNAAMAGSVLLYEAWRQRHAAVPSRPPSAAGEAGQ